MIRSVGFVLVFVAATAAFGQTVSKDVVPPKLSTYICNGCWRCEGSGVACNSDVTTGYGNTPAEAEIDCESKLDEIDPGVCGTGNGPPTKNLFDPVPEEGGFARLQSIPITGPWTVSLTYTFGNGERMSKTASGCTYCEAYQSAWNGILRLASRKCGVCCCTGKCEIVERPARPCGCQPNSCCHHSDQCRNARPRLRMRCR